MPIKYTECANCGKKTDNKMFCSDECRYYATRTPEQAEEDYALNLFYGQDGSL